LSGDLFLDDGYEVEGLGVAERCEDCRGEQAHRLLS
jgi:hypothetical protein